MRRLTPRLLPTLAMSMGMVILLGLSGWQFARHVEKNAGVEPARDAAGLPTLDASALEQSPLPLYRHLALPGRFVGPVLLEGGRVLGGQPAYGVVQAFETSAGKRIFVDRGEILSNDRRGALSRLPTPGSVQGQLRPVPESRGRTPVNPGDSPEIWRRRSLGSMYDALPDLEPGIYLRAGPALAKGVAPTASPDLADGYRPASIRTDSLHYAFQWLAIAGVLFGLWAWASLEKP